VHKALVAIFVKLHENQQKKNKNEKTKGKRKRKTLTKHCNNNIYNTFESLK
jgi:hypothetical protein